MRQSLQIPSATTSSHLGKEKANHHYSICVRCRANKQQFDRPCSRVDGELNVPFRAVGYRLVYNRPLQFRI